MFILYSCIHIRITWQTDSRQQKGIEITNSNLITKIDENSYKVKSQTGKGEYEIISTGSGYICSCPDSMYRNLKCKHVIGLEISLAIKKEVKVRNTVVIEPISTSNCIYCKSKKIVRDGFQN